MSNVTPEEKEALVEAAKKAVALIMSAAKTPKTQLASASIVFSIIAEYHDVAALSVGDNESGLMTYVSRQAIQNNPQLVDMMLDISATAGKSVNPKKTNKKIKKLLALAESSVH